MCNYALRNIASIKKEGEKKRHRSFMGPLVGFCLIMLTICLENGVRFREQTRLIYFSGPSTQPNYCVTNGDSFTPLKEHFD